MNITEVLQHLSIPFKSEGEHHHCREGWINIDCSQCSKDWQHYRLGINLEHHYAHCWQCGSLPLVNVLMDLSGKNFKEIKTLLSELSIEKLDKTEKLKGSVKLPKELGPLLQPHLDYLVNEREYPLHEIESLKRLYGLRGLGIAGTLSWRIYIPITYRGEVVSWTTRSISNNTKRYINARPSEESLSPKSLLYNEESVRHSVIVTEGPTDVWRIGPGSVALMGLTFTKAQVLKISRHPVRVIILDNEVNAQKVAKRLCDSLKCFPGKTFNIQLDASDPGSASKREIKMLRRSFLD